MRSLALSVLALVLALAPDLARSDEGMWTFNHFPRELVKKRYRVDVTQPWLDHVRLAAVRFNNGGSGAFVSSRGLVMTNHHVGADCIQKLGRGEHDYVQAGFVASGPNDELKCPDLELNVLTDIQDVTAEVQAAATPGMDDAAMNQAQKEKMAQLEKGCADETQGRCDVVTLYHGGLYNLYVYKKYTDVRLVFAPELQIAFFGGDTDNFEFPRYDLDVAYFRVYEKGRPVHPEHYLRWSANGAKSGELVFVPGNPGTTERLDTFAELTFLRDVALPFFVQQREQRERALTAYSQKGSTERRQAQRALFGVMNSLKVYRGRVAGLSTASLMAQKRAEEGKLKRQLAKDPAYARAWAEIAAAQKDFRPFFVRYQITERNYGPHLLRLAEDLVRLSAERQKPNGQRLREFRASNLPSVELALFSAAPVYRGLEEADLASYFEFAAAQLGAKDPYVQQLLGGKTAAERAHELVSGTKLIDVAFRQALAKNPKLLATSTDPLIVLARALDPERRRQRRLYEDTVEGRVRRNHEVLARGLWKAVGTSRYPDATFTLRLSFGKVTGYTEQGKRVAPMTTIAGLFRRAAAAQHRAPWSLPASWTSAQPRLAMSTPLNFVTTNDIIGGNSGSPVVNARGEVVGLIFDSNKQALVSDFIYDGRQNRAVAVHSAGLMEALRQVYHADRLVDELTGKASNEHAAR